LAVNQFTEQTDARPMIRVDITQISGLYTVPTPTLRPWIMRVAPAGSAVSLVAPSVEIVFNLPMDTSVAGTVTLNGISLTGGTWDSTRRTVTFDLSNVIQLESDTEYILAISGFTARTGAVMLADSSHSFRTVRQLDGDFVILGNYGGIPLEWEIVETEGQGETAVYTLVLNGLLPGRAFRAAYTAQNANVWAASDIRNYLNNTFLNDAFTAEERDRIIPYNGDNVTIPSVVEYNTWWDSQLHSIHPVNTSSWWLRDPGTYNRVAMYVLRDVGLAVTTGVMTNTELGVRPVIRVGPETEEVQPTPTPSPSPTPTPPGNDVVAPTPTPPGNNVTAPTPTPPGAVAPPGTQTPSPGAGISEERWHI